MDTCAILECDPTISQAQMLTVRAQLAVYGIEAIYLPPGMTLAGMKDQGDAEDHEDC